MDADKVKRLKIAGLRVRTTEESFGLTQKDMQAINRMMLQHKRSTKKLSKEHRKWW